MLRVPGRSDSEARLPLQVAGVAGFIAGPDLERVVEGGVQVVSQEIEVQTRRDPMKHVVGRLGDFVPRARLEGETVPPDI